MKKCIRAALCFLTLLALAAPAGAAEKEATPLEKYWRVYGYTAPDNQARAEMDGFREITLKNDLVTVTVKQVIWDGYFLFTAAAARPNDPEKTLIIPAGLDKGDPVNGIWGETARRDARSFAKAAKEDGKRLLAVYAYPREFEIPPIDAPYMLDALQEGDGLSLLLACAAMPERKGALQLHFGVQTYDAENEYALIDDMQAEITVSPAAPAASAVYQAEKGLPFPALTLNKHAAGVYADAGVNEKDFVLSGEDGKEYPRVPLPDSPALLMDALPDTVFVSAIDEKTGEPLPPVPMKKR